MALCSAAHCAVNEDAFGALQVPAATPTALSPSVSSQALPAARFRSATAKRSRWSCRLKQNCETPPSSKSGHVG